jgi:Tfp pilus assembly protein PilO
MTEEKEIVKKVNYSKYIIILVILVIILIVASYLILNLIDGQVDQIQEQRAHLSALNNRDNSYAQLQDDFKKIENQYYLIDQALPDQDNFVKFIVDIEKLADKNQVNLAIVFPSEPVVENNQLGFNLEISGNLDYVVKYLQELKQLPYYIKIDSANFSKTAKQKVGGEVSIKVGVDETFQFDQVSN